MKRTKFQSFALPLRDSLNSQTADSGIQASWKHSAKKSLSATATNIRQNLTVNFKVQFTVSVRRLWSAWLHSWFPGHQAVFTITREGLRQFIFWISFGAEEDELGSMGGAFPSLMFHELQILFQVMLSTTSRLRKTYVALKSRLA